MRFTAQHDQMDCGPACLAMIADHYGQSYSLSYLRDNAYLTREGVSLLGIKEAAIKIGFDVFSTLIPIERLIEEKEVLPAILHWNQNHFVVLKKISRHRFTGQLRFHMADPAHGFITLSQERFAKHWISENNKGVVLYLCPNALFHQLTPPRPPNISVRYLLKYLVPHKKSLFRIFLFLALGAGISFLFPLLTQQLIDKGIQAKNLHYISLILLAQLSLFLGNTVFDMMRNWIMLIIGTKINIRIIADFLTKLLKLPIQFFETKLMGDFNQRISDHDRIEYFLTSQSIFTFFSLITFIVFSIVLAHYNLNILLIYMGLSIISVLWSVFWLKRRKILDYFRFQNRSENQEAIYEIISGVTEIKLNQFENYKRNKWESIQTKLFTTNIRILKLDQIKIGGFDFINQIKNILVTFLAARLVTQDILTLGMLMSISYIIGQMNSPINQVMNFLQALQNAKLSLIRLNEVQNHPDEETLIQEKNKAPLHTSHLLEAPIRIENLSFQYEGPKSPFILKDIHLSIPPNKITAIVGASGSGKTTLIKLLLKFYAPTEGNIFIGATNLNAVSPHFLRTHSGTVMQDGFIFGDTIERNIVCGDTNIDAHQLQEAIKIANIEELITSLPLGLNTKIGASGSGLSGGQKQRILIARAVYKNPHFLFLDEATSALDAENEKIIHDNLQKFFTNKTVLIVAHRLSTVKNAHQIIVLKKGMIQEIGTHSQLVKQQGTYFHLIKNQLELGN